MPWSTIKANLVRASMVAAAALAWSCAGANATTIGFSWSGANGYSATGSFTYDAATAPAVITESGAGATTSVQSFSVTFLDPNRTVLESGSSVIASVSSDRFFRLTFDTATNAVSVLDADIGGTYIYFLTNLRTPTGGTVPAGTTGFNFFDRRQANAALDIAPTLRAFAASVPVSVPEPPAFLISVAALASLLAVKRRAG